MATHPVYDDLPTEYFEYDGSGFDTRDALYSTQRRHYDAAEGVWLNEDPVGFEGGQAHRYRYPANGPE